MTQHNATLAMQEEENRCFMCHLHTQFNAVTEFLSLITIVFRPLLVHAYGRRYLFLLLPQKQKPLC